MLGFGSLAQAGLNFLSNGINAGLQAWQNKKNKQHDINMFDNSLSAQKEFAQNGISWRVNDARNAGIHPLAALGANVSSGPTMAVGNPGTAPQLGKFDYLAVQNAKLQNDLLKAQIANLNGQTFRNTTEVASPRVASLTDMPGQSGSLTQANRGALQSKVAGYHEKPQDLYAFMRDSEGNILRGPNPDLPDAYTEGPLSLGLAVEMFRKFSDKELGRVADLLIKNGELNPNTHDLITGISPLGRYIKIHPKNKKFPFEKFKDGLIKFWEFFPKAERFSGIPHK